MRRAIAALAALNSIAEVGVGRHRPRHPQGAVPAVRTQLKEHARPDPPHRCIKNLALLVTHVDQEAFAVAELVNHPDRVVEVAGSRVRGDVIGERLLPTVADLPLPEQVLLPGRHPQEGPPQEEHGLPGDVVGRNRGPGGSRRAPQPARDTQGVPPGRRGQRGAGRRGGDDEGARQLLHGATSRQ
jgi:hypothetical protein